MRKILAVLAAAVMLTSCLTGCVDKSVIGSVDGQTVTPGVYNYYLNSAIYSTVQSNGVQSYEQFAALTDENGRSVLAVVKEQAFEQIIWTAALRKMCEANGLEWTDEDQQQLEAQIQSDISGVGGSTAFNDYLKQLGMTREEYNEVSKDNIYMSKLYLQAYGDQPLDTMTDEQAREKFDSDYIKAKHILYATLDPATRTALPETDILAKKNRAEQTAAAIAAGAAFEDFEADNEDPGSASSPDGYVFTHGEMVEPFETAAYALGVGEVSGVVESSYGYHIIKRVAADEADFEAVKDTIINADANQRLMERYQELYTIVTDQAVNIPYETNDRKIDAINIKKVFFGGV